MVTVDRLFDMTIDQAMAIPYMRIDEDTALPLPADCETCLGFYEAVKAEPISSVWKAGFGTQIMARFRIFHHHPRFAFVDRGVEFMKMVKRLPLGESVQRDVARFVVMAEQVE